MLQYIEQLDKEADEPGEERSGVGNSCQERGLDPAPQERRKLHDAPFARAEPCRKDIGCRWQRRRWWRMGGPETLRPGFGAASNRLTERHQVPHAVDQRVPEIEHVTCIR